VSCVNYNAFQHRCQQLLKSFFVIFLQQIEVTIFLLYEYLYLLSIPVPICGDFTTFYFFTRLSLKISQARSQVHR
jgi:hypothetical protein